MEYLVLSLLIFLGMLFMCAELLLFPGVTIGGILSMVCYGGGIYLAFTNHGSMVGWIVVAIVLVLSAVMLYFSLRSKTWERFSLKQTVDSASSQPLEQSVKIGDRGVAISRLAPSGRVLIDGATYEAKSMGSYINEKSMIEVISFDNFTIIVKFVE